VLLKEYLPSFEPAPKATFRIISKLDLAFASLLQGRHIDTGEALPGFEGGRGISATEKVRIKSVVDRTRVVVAEVLEGVDVAANDLEDEAADDDMEMDEENEEMESMSDCEMGIAKVYDRTIVELGDTVGGTPIGIITDD
jgi:Subunit 11 of the general transcription factor TFIIH